MNFIQASLNISNLEENYEYALIIYIMVSFCDLLIGGLFKSLHSVE